MISLVKQLEEEEKRVEARRRINENYEKKIQLTLGNDT